MTRIEVRCCCHPEKLWGTIEIPEAYLEFTHINVAVSIQRTMGRVIKHPFVRFEIAEITTYDPTTPVFPITTETETSVRSRYRALKKPHDVTIEDLRMLTGFVESK